MIKLGNWGVIYFSLKNEQRNGSTSQRMNFNERAARYL